MLSSSEKSVRNIPMTHPRIKILTLLRISFAKSENMTPLPIRTYATYIARRARWTGMFLRLAYARLQKPRLSRPATGIPGQFTGSWQNINCLARTIYLYLPPLRGLRRAPQVAPTRSATDTLIVSGRPFSINIQVSS